jgi:twitching motility protein PilI
VGPFDTLLDIERNCKAYAVNIPRQIVTERDWFGVGFRSSGFNFVCPLSQVSEILTWPVITTVPGAYPWFKGVANLRGRILSVTDLQGFITKKTHQENILSRILVVAFDGNFYGFSVEQVLGVERFFGEEIKPIGALKELKEYLSFAEGVFEKAHELWVILNFHSIIKVAEFYHVVSTRMETV